METSTEPTKDPKWITEAGESVADMVAEWYSSAMVVGGNDIPANLIVRRLARFAPVELPSRAAEPGGNPEIHRCFICNEPFRSGEMILSDVSGELGHRQCYGEDREGYVDDLDEGTPLKAGEPIPAGEPYDPADYPDFLVTSATSELHGENARLRPFEDELRKIAEDVGEADDPFAAWETVSAIKEDLAAAQAKCAQLMEREKALVAGLAGVADHAVAVMNLLSENGGKIVPHLLDTDENAGEYLREACRRAHMLVADAPIAL